MWINSKEGITLYGAIPLYFFFIVANFFIIFNKDKNESLFDYKNICIDPLN
jgi:hypothetical protein